MERRASEKPKSGRISARVEYFHEQRERRGPSKTNSKLTVAQKLTRPASHAAYLQRNASKHQGKLHPEPGVTKTRTQGGFRHKPRRNHNDTRLLPESTQRGDIEHVPGWANPNVLNEMQMQLGAMAQMSDPRCGSCRLPLRTPLHVVWPTSAGNL